MEKILAPYIEKRRTSKQESDDYLSVWLESPHVAGKRSGEEYNSEELAQQTVIINVAAHINTAVTLFWYEQRSFINF